MERIGHFIRFLGGAVIFACFALVQKPIKTTPIVSASDRTKSISLGEKARWAIEGLSDYEPFFRNLTCLLPESDAVIYLEGVEISPEVRRFLEEHAVAPGHEVCRGTIWPQPSIFHLPASPEVLQGLAELASRHMYPEIANHCHVYTKDGMILQWYDACDPGSSLNAGSTISEGGVNAFCDLTGAAYHAHADG